MQVNAAYCDRTGAQDKSTHRVLFTDSVVDGPVDDRVGQKFLDLQKQLEEWRNKFTIQLAKQCNNNVSGDRAFSMAVLCSGGCLDTIAGIRAGFQAKWSTEVSTAQAKMFEDLTGGICHGDTFGKAVDKADRVSYMKSGQPCTDYSRAGTATGSNGKTGWMFVAQVDVIMKALPWAVCLEISDYATEVNNGDEVVAVKTALEEAYVVYVKLIAVWKHGDPSNRRRLFMVGFHKELGQAAHCFTWPVESHTECGVPVARMIAIPDSEVPESYWRYDSITENDQWENEGKPYKIQVVARTGKGMGPKGMPHSIQSWEGILNGPTTLGGGGRHVELNWKSGQDITRTRLTTPREFCRAASQCDEYIDWCATYAVSNVDEFAMLCLNNGVPQRTSFAIDQQVMMVLKAADLHIRHPIKRFAALTIVHDTIRSSLLDTGANGSINLRDCEPYLMDCRASQCNITVANNQRLKVGCDGTLPMQVLNTALSVDSPIEVQLDVETTTAQVPMELFSFDQFYRTGKWGLHCRPTDSLNQDAELYKIDGNYDTVVCIPLRYDWSGQGGFWLDYSLIEHPEEQHKELLVATHNDNKRALSAETESNVLYFDRDQLRAMLLQAADDDLVVDLVDSGIMTEVDVGQHESDRSLRGVKSGLKAKAAKLTEAEFHQHYGHIGHMPNCEICKMTKGASRRIYKKVDPHCETRVAYKWHMDTVTWDARSSNGNIYMTVLRDEASGLFKLLIHYLKSDVRDVLKRYVRTIRADPAFHDCPYKVFSELNLDNAGEWDLDCREFKEFVEEQGIRTVYTCPDRKESASRAEKACGIVEA